VFSNLQRDLPLPVAAMLISLLLPPELSIELGGLRLSGYRIVLLIMFVPMLYALMLRPSIRISYADWGMIFVSVWSLLALVVHEGLVEAIEKGGILIVEMFGSYLIARIYITRYQQLLAVAKLLTMMVAFVLIVSIPESLSVFIFCEVPVSKFIPSDSACTVLMALSIIRYYMVLFALRFSPTSIRSSRQIER